MGGGGRGAGGKGRGAGGRVCEYVNVFYKESESKKSICFFFLFCFGRGGGGQGEGMARVSECFTKDPNKKNCFWRERGWGGVAGGGGS